jgi:hypothetical protein
MRDSGTRPRIPPAWAIIPSEHVPERAGTVAFIGNQTRQGEWILPRLFRAVSVMGNITIDLTRARIAAGASDIEVRSVFGNIEILVPPEMRVECDGSTLAGNFESDAKMRLSYDPDAPLVRITGMAILGNVEVKVVDPNEPTWLEKVAARLSGRRQIAGDDI